MIKMQFSRYVKHIFLIFVSIVSLFPTWFIFQTALKTNLQYTLHPLGFPVPATIANFVQTFTSLPILKWSMNSVIVTLASATMATGIALLAGYAFIYGKFIGRDLLFNTNLALMVVPPITLLTPMFILMVNVHLINRLPSVIIFYVGLFLPFSIFFLTNFLRSMPYEIIEAARVDGLGPFGILRRIVTPLAVPALFTLLLVNVIYAWNELLIALVFLQQEDSRTLMSGLAVFQGRYVTQQPFVMAGAFLSMLPILVLYVFGQRFFVRGLTAGIGK